MHDVPTVSEQIRAARERLGWSQRDLAAVVGCNQAAIARVESGTRDTPLAFLARLATALRVSLVVAPGIDQVIEKK